MRLAYAAFRRVVACTALALAALLSPPFAAHAQQALGAPQRLDGFDDPATWHVVASNQVSAKLATVAGEGGAGKALCLDYDFNGVSGYAGIQRDLAIDYPDNYAFGFRLRGDSPANDLQMKFVDASGDNVWWVNRPRYAFPKEWTDVRYKKRQIDKAWGPNPERVLKRSAKLEYTIYNHAGGKGRVCFDELTLQRLAPQDDGPLRAQARAGSGDPRFAVDGDASTAWRASGADERLVLDLGAVREFGGLTLAWRGADFASDYRVQRSDDGEHFVDVREVSGGNGGVDWIALPESEARYLGIVPRRGPTSRFALAEARVEPLAFAATQNDFLKAIAAQSPRGRFPRGFSGEQPYWTLIGLDGGTDQGLIGEDGAVELARGGVSVEPFVVADDRLVTWADADIAQSLQDGDLPIPSVDWTHPAFGLRVTAFAEGTPAQSRLVLRYRLSNAGQRTRSYVLALAVRPLQVNPPSQFLSTVGGVSPIRALDMREDAVSIDGRPRLRANRNAFATFASPFDAGDVVERLAQTDWARFARTVQAAPDAARALIGDRSGNARDGDGLASGALLYRVTLAPGASYEVDLEAPLTGDAGESGAASAAPPSGDARQARVAALWRDKLDRVDIRVPAQGRALVDTLRTATAHMLISRIGPRLQPGTRSYSRSWIRDGAMISEGLLRMGREDVVRDYVGWYAPYQFKDGMVPCCVDDRGSDPVPENDSHGELIFAIAELYRYGGDKAFLRTMWPRVTAAFGYMEKLRLSERTEANRTRNPAFYGMMPASISHEGYSAKPMHSYWDGFWALRGYKDAVEIARWLGEDAAARRFAQARDTFHADLDASLQTAARQHGIDYLPGSAELGDFDPTSSTIALAPGGEEGRPWEPLLRNGFERYWREFEQRRDGARAWKDYTPYEWRNVSAFVRLGWRERAWRATDYFFGHRTPRPWNQWAEVVSHTPRKPFFLGDLPHAWVASDFVRSALDMFAYARERDDSLVLAAGIPADWLDGEGIAVRGLRTAQGPLSYALRRHGRSVTLRIEDDGLRLPPGGLVLPWPYRGAPGAASVNGKAARWEQGELRIRALPAQVAIAMPDE